MNFVSNKYKQRLKTIKKGVERQFGQGTPTNWRNRNFEDLSFEINKATKVLISAATLKRIFGKNKTSESYYPQESTLEAMELFAGLHLQSPSNSKKWIAAGIPVLLVIVGLIILFFATFTKEETAEIKASLSLKKIEGNTPATGFFNYVLPSNNDSIFISFGDGCPLQYLPKNTQTLTHVYNYPGLFNVTLQTRQYVVSDTLKVLVPTTDWQVLASYYQQNYRDRHYPLLLDRVTGPEGLHPSGKDLAGIGMDTTQIVVLRLDNFRNTKANGDSFTLKTRLKNINYWPAIRCYSAYINVIGENGSIIFKLTNKGCSGFGEFTLSEKSGHGSNTDLSALTLDIKSWHYIEIINQQKYINLKINNETVFENSYSKSIGDIVGVSLQFHGSGYVDYFEMLDKTNKPIFLQDF